MNAMTKNHTLDTIQGTIQDIRYMVEPIVSDPTAPKLFDRISRIFEGWAQASYNAWESAGRPGHF